MQTCAGLSRDEYIIDGRKLWITNRKEAGIFVLFANMDPSAGYRGITAFIVEKEFPGFSVGKKEDKLGIRASSTCEIGRAPSELQSLRHLVCRLLLEKKKHIM